jgi:hypothetical protein
MTRDRIARALLRVYPNTVRRSHGQEMLATLLDSSEGSTRAFIGELCDLLRAGLRSRSRATADAGLKRLMADGFCLAAMLWIAVTISEPSGFQPTSRRFWLIAAALALALVGYDRVAGLVGFTCIVLFDVVAPFGGQAHVTVIGVSDVPQAISQNLGPMIFLLVMALAPRRRPRDLRRLLWLAPVAAVALAESPGSGLLLISIIVVSVASLASLCTDPRPAIAAALWWTTAGIDWALRTDNAASPLWVALVAPGLTVVALAAARVRQLQRQTPP